MITKFTEGYVKQEFDDDGKCISQKFVAGDKVDYENSGVPCSCPSNEQYQPYDMVQPGFVQVKETEFADQRNKMQEDISTILGDLNCETIKQLQEVVINRFAILRGRC